MPRLGLYVLDFFSNVHYYDFLGMGIDLQAGHFLYKFQKGGRKRAIEVCIQLINKEEGSKN